VVPGGATTGLVWIFHHDQISISDLVAPQPLFGVPAVFFQTAGNDPSDFLGRNDQGTDPAEESPVPHAVVVFTLIGIAAKNTVEINAPVTQIIVMQQVPLENPRGWQELAEMFHLFLLAGLKVNGRIGDAVFPFEGP
jgi:hypothetical protein